MTAEEEKFDILVDKVTEKVEERLENKIESVRTPEKQVMRGSIVAPSMPEIEDDEALRKLLEQIREMMAEMLESALSDLKGDIQVTNLEEIYEILEDYSIKYWDYRIRLGTQIRRAYCKTAAGAAATIVCYLDTDATGTEITVTCIIAGGGNLNSAIPRLTDGLEIPVWKDGSTWKCLWGFQASEDCVCS